MTLALAAGLLVPIGVLGTSLADNIARLSGKMIAAFEGGPPPPPGHGWADCRCSVPNWSGPGTTSSTIPPALPRRRGNT
ncbi:MAG: hypothetical protein U1E38_09525 [Rhodospirillales bacterium]